MLTEEDLRILLVLPYFGCKQLPVLAEQNDKSFRMRDRVWPIHNQVNFHLDEKKVFLHIFVFFFWVKEKKKKTAKRIYMRWKRIQIWRKGTRIIWKHTRLRWWHNSKSLNSPMHTASLGDTDACGTYQNQGRDNISVALTSNHSTCHPILPNSTYSLIHSAGLFIYIYIYTYLLYISSYRVCWWLMTSRAVISNGNFYHLSTTWNVYEKQNGDIVLVGHPQPCVFVLSFWQYPGYSVTLGYQGFSSSSLGNLDSSDKIL